MNTKICLACSAGGHLSELYQLKPFFEKKEHFLVTDRRIDSIVLAKKERVYFVECPRRNPLKLAKNFLHSIKIFLMEKPDIVVSTGADTAFSICLLAKLFGKRLVFIESFCRVKEPSLSGRIFYRIADVFLVQWKENLEFFPKAKYWGGVF